MKSRAGLRKLGLGPIRHVTVVTDDLRASVRAYRDYLGYEVHGEGQVGESLAIGWAAPSTAGAQYAVVGPASGVGGSVRLVRCPVPAQYRPVLSYGWSALEVCVPDVDRLAEQLAGGPFRILVPPAPLGGIAAAALRAMQVVGPSGEVVYFTEIRGPLPPFELPTCSGSVDGVFIAVVAAADLELTRAWWEGHFDVVRASDRRVAVRVTNVGFGLPPETMHRISSLQLRGSSAVEIDQYPPSATRRPLVAGFLPPGIASVGFDVMDFDVTGPRFDVTDAGTNGVMMGPDGLRVELISR